MDASTYDWPTGVIVIDRKLSREDALKEKLVYAAIAMADRGDIGSDEVVRIAREIKAMRERT